MRIRPRNNLRFLLGNFKKLLKILFRVEINQLSALDSGLLIKIYILYYFLRTPLCVCEGFVCGWKNYAGVCSRFSQGCNYHEITFNW